MTGRTRRYELKAPAARARIEVQHTLLGIELKVGNRRLMCPDLATARYLSVFARLGCEQIAVPYEITRVSSIADDMESSWQRMLLLIDRDTPGASAQVRARIRRHLTALLRSRIAALGAGQAFPEFTRPGKGRRR